VTGDNPRLLELRRRVQADPASIAFAQLAEECRRAGETDEAVGICRAGLVHHPDYLSARVTLGRALLELGRLDEAQAELNMVLSHAADNLAANRALAEVYQKRGQLKEALAQYKQALELAKFDPDLESEVQRIENAVSPPPAAPKQEAAPVSVEDLFDFDTLLEQLGGRTQPKPEFPKPIEPAIVIPSLLERVELKADDTDPFSRLEMQLRETEASHGAPVTAAAGPTEQELRDRRVLDELEDWLAAIVTDRHTHLSA
jgi:tetratricopeptide (TPR) repeat protein